MHFNRFLLGRFYEDVWKCDRTYRIAQSTRYQFERGWSFSNEKWFVVFLFSSTRRHFRFGNRLKDRRLLDLFPRKPRSTSKEKSTRYFPFSLLSRESLPFRFFSFFLSRISRQPCTHTSKRFELARYYSNVARFVAEEHLNRYTRL